MKAVAVLVFFALIAVSCNGDGYSANDSSTPDHLYFDSINFDAGIINSITKKRVRFQFDFVNRSNQNIVISHIETSCGCTVAEPDKLLILPEQGGTISGTFNLSSLGSNKTDILLFFNDFNKQADPIKLTVQAKYLPDIEISSTPTIISDAVFGGTSKDLQVEVSLLSKSRMGPKDMIEFLSVRGSITAELIEETYSEISNHVGYYRKSYKYRLKTNGSTPGRLHDELLFTFQGNDSVHLRVPVSGEIRSSYAITPNKIVFVVDGSSSGEHTKQLTFKSFEHGGSGFNSTLKGFNLDIDDNQKWWDIDIHPRLDSENIFDVRLDINGKIHSRISSSGVVNLVFNDSGKDFHIDLPVYVATTD